MIRIIIFDDVVFARGETFNIPGVETAVYEHADDAAEIANADPPDIIFMDYSMGDEHASGADAIRRLREAGFAGKIVAISSDPPLNREMEAAGADDQLAKKALLRPYLVSLGTRVDSA